MSESATLLLVENKNVLISSEAHWPWKYQKIPTFWLSIFSISSGTFQKRIRKSYKLPYVTFWQLSNCWGSTLPNVINGEITWSHIPQILLMLLWNISYTLLWTEASNGPANHAVLLGNNASLTCADGAPGKWTFYRDGSSGKQISNTRSSYIINQTNSEDAGLYGCFSSNGERRAQLIILGKCCHVMQWILPWLRCLSRTNVHLMNLFFKPSGR